MQSSDDLKAVLKSIDRSGYKSYKTLAGRYKFEDYVLIFDKIQSDPFARPSRLRVRVPCDVAGFPQALYSSPVRRIALGDYLTRKFYSSCNESRQKVRGSGKSGALSIVPCGQEVLDRSSMFITDEYVEARFVAGLPADGRIILGNEAYAMLFGILPNIVRQSLKYQNLDKNALTKHIEVVEDQEFMRQKLVELGLIAFVADGSILPRRSGVDDRPMAGIMVDAGTLNVVNPGEIGASIVIPFKSPQSLRIEIKTPNRGTIGGMALAPGVTLIAGGGFHGKSTLLSALEKGIYNHLPGDGREYVVTTESAIKIKSEQGRNVEKVDIRPFIDNLPFEQSTSAFTTQNASGSTSQSASIMESLQMGAELILIDEDTSATNFMIRDVRMQQLVPKDREPITPFVDKIRQMYSDLDVSTILVMGGSGDYFDVADTVLVMDNYLVKDMTVKAQTIAIDYRTKRQIEGGDRFGELISRCPIKRSMSAHSGQHEVKLEVKGKSKIQYGESEIDLSALDQLVDRCQTRAIADAIYYGVMSYLKDLDSSMTIPELIKKICQDISEKGLDILSPYVRGDYAKPRSFEIGAAINRLRSLKVRQIRPKEQDQEGVVGEKESVG
ncbi:MAG: ABC-ATPase domain-containing protein [Candidatus Coatesbacteria bacterium]|nr:ABC-ATPase domain-containing protein [Candidatus Coatesbacteria bacterium]